MALAGSVKRYSIKRLFWGRMAEADWPTRIGGLVFALVAIAALSFCQLGFWPICVIDGKAVYLMLLLAPLIMDALIFGPLMATLLGLYAGAVVYAHATFLPLDFYELYFMTVLNTFVMLTLLGTMAGWLFWLIFQRNPQGGKRLALIAAVCLGMSFVASGLVVLNTIVVYSEAASVEAVYELLINSPRGLAVQALVDFLLMVVFCWSADAIVTAALRRRNDRTLLAIFRNWMFLISAIVFMIASAVTFTITSMQAELSAQVNMMSEVRYLGNQLNASKTENYDQLLEGYEVDLDGYVVIIDKEGKILATDDEERYPVGEYFLDLLGYTPADYGPGEDRAAFTAEYFGDVVSSDDISAVQITDDQGVLSMDLTFLSAAAFGDAVEDVKKYAIADDGAAAEEDAGEAGSQAVEEVSGEAAGEPAREPVDGAITGGYVAMMRSYDMVYAERLGTMIAITVLALALIAAMALLATVLLNRVVVRRVDETNVTLGKITRGDLNERLDIRDTREFMSLSSGINTTVAALKDTIEAVEQKNAQELATAKAIQESMLPTDYPAFPDIDRFDIYGSMKTAKEVGGDFYDFFQIEGADKIGFVMADVSGKGIPAALFMMTAKTQIRTYVESGIPIDEAVNAANHQLCLNNDAGMFVTMIACVLDYQTGELAYVNAGHNPPIIQHDGSWTWMRKVSGMPLGLFDGIPYERIDCQVEEGDVLYLYTDGVTEAMDVAGNMFGEERLESTLCKFTDYNPRSISVGVRRAITDFSQDCEQSDDITMLCLKYGVPPEEKAVMVLDADDSQLVHVCNYIHGELHRRRAPKSVYNQLDIAAEELFVNVCHYAYPDATPENPGKVRISFEYEANPPSITVQISDDGIPYNPLAKPDAVTPDDIADVPIGGLGILIAKKSVDEMTYERVGDSNVLTFVKQW